MKIINIIDNIEKVNFGVWNAAISTFSILKERYDMDSELWYPATNKEPKIEKGLEKTALHQLSPKEVNKLITSRQLNPKDTIVNIHGCWRYPTRWGGQFGKLGFKWIYVPHGMLEPWQLEQKALKKFVYLRLVEKPIALKADYIRAVSGPEQANLSKLFPEYSAIGLIPNGVPKTKDIDLNLKSKKPRVVLFLGRLHHKKGVFELVQAWVKSKLFNNPQFKLVIAGPDQTELPKIETLLSSLPEQRNNIEYIGAIYGVDKIKLLNNCSFFALPSKSEGFPTSVLEAMSYGMIPLITEGCNFPELLATDLAVKVSPKVDDIIAGLNRLTDLDLSNLEEHQTKCIQFINDSYSLDSIAAQQVKLYKELLSV